MAKEARLRAALPIQPSNRGFALLAKAGCEHPPCSVLVEPVCQCSLALPLYPHTMTSDKRYPI